MTVAPSNNRISKQSLIDLMVAMIAVPLLVVFGLMLESNMRGEWTIDPETRWHVLGLGLGLLFISLMVMGYVTHRLGICIWQASQTDDVLSGGRRGHRNNGSRAHGDSQLHLVVSGELPPSYESVVSFDMPPPYCSILVFNDKNTSNDFSQQPKQSGRSAQQPKQYETSAQQQPKQPQAPTQTPLPSGSSDGTSSKDTTG